MNDISPTIKNDLQIINNVSSSVASDVEDLIDHIYKEAMKMLQNN